MKYIIIDGQPILFSEGIVHKDMAVGWRQVESAGFVTLISVCTKEEDDNYIKAVVHGESLSLGIKNRGDFDNKIIETVINHHY